MAQIQARFKDPVFVNEFISTYEPRQWFGVFKLMYDNLVVAAPQKMPSSQPLRNRPTLSGMPQAAAGDHVGAMKSVLAQMGIGGMVRPHEKYIVIERLVPSCSRKDEMGVGRSIFRLR
jgi:hypothetical protein